MRAEIDRVLIEDVVAGLETAWNKAEGAQFAVYFDEDADFVNIHGLRVKGRQKIAEGHDVIFRTIYQGSTLRCLVSQVRFLDANLALAHINARLSVPRYPVMTEVVSVPSLVLRRGASGWSIASFHNTVVQPSPVLANRHGM